MPPTNHLTLCDKSVRRMFYNLFFDTCCRFNITPSLYQKVLRIPLFKPDSDRLMVVLVNFVAPYC